MRLTEALDIRCFDEMKCPRFVFIHRRLIIYTPLFSSFTDLEDFPTMEDDYNTFLPQILTFWIFNTPSPIDHTHITRRLTKKCP